MAERLRRKGQPVTMVALARGLGVSRATLYRLHGGAAGVSAVVGDKVGTRHDDAELFAGVKAVMGERGIRGTTLEAVAERAGVSVVTLTRRFGDRLGLLRAFMDATPARRAGRELAHADVHDVAGVLRGFVRLALVEFEESLGVTRAMLGDPEAARELSSSARDPSRGVSAGVAAWFSRCVAAGTLRGDPAAMTAYFLSALFGYGLMSGSFRPEAKLATDAAVELLVNGFLEGARP